MVPVPVCTFELQAIERLSSPEPWLSTEQRTVPLLSIAQHAVHLVCMLILMMDLNVLLNKLMRMSASSFDRQVWKEGANGWRWQLQHRVQHHALL